MTSLVVKVCMALISSWYSSLKCFNKAIAFIAVNLCAVAELGSRKGLDFNKKNKMGLYISWQPLPNSYLYLKSTSFNAQIALIFVPMALQNSVLIISQSLVAYGITRMAITYLDTMLGGRILMSAGLANIVDGLSSVLVLVLTYISDTWTGRFKMVFCISIANVTGCWLFLIWFKFGSLPIFIISLLLLTIFARGEEIIGTAFLGDQMCDQQDPDQVVVHAEFWTNICKIVGTISFGVGVGRLVQIWQIKFIAMAITVGLISYLFGSCYYNHKPPNGSPLASVKRVLKAAYLNRHLVYPTSPIEFHQNDGFELRLKPHVNFFRWFDKAAIKQVCPPITLEEQERRGMVCPVQQVKDVKFLLSIFPMWITFLVYHIVSATGDSFYVLQADQMQGTSVSYALLFATQSVGNSLSWGLSNLCLRMVQKSIPTARPRTWKVNMTVGMICAFLSCFIAVFVEKHRLQSYKEQWLNYKGEAHINYLTIFWLVPQFFFLGLMNGLCSDAFLMFYKSHVTESMKSYGIPFNECVLGFGKFFSAFLMVACKPWFGRTLNESHLDNYYLLVAILALLSLFPFYYVSSLPLYDGDGAVDDPSIQIKEIQLSTSGRVYPSTTVDGHGIV